MIKIDKCNSIPNKLNIEGVIQTSKLKQLYENAPDNFTATATKKNENVCKFEFDNKIYADISVKKQLIQDQNEKCCFCESIFNANSYGDVEHFRPKAAIELNGKLKYPAYYWLVYDWNNLMFSCQICNQKYKKNEFPVLDENTRVKTHNDTNQIDNELHTLINPIIENPEDYIYFKRQIPLPKPNLSSTNKLRATETIRIFGIDRKELNRDRLEYLNMLKILKPYLNIDLNNQVDLESAIKLFKISEKELIENITMAKKMYENAAKNSSKFANMIRTNFPELQKK